MLRPLLHKVDTSRFLGNFLTGSSSFLARRRGLLMLAGTGITILSLILTAIFMLVIVSSAEVSNIWLLLCIPATLLHLGVILGLIGVMMVIPLGQSYGE